MIKRKTEIVSSDIYGIKKVQEEHERAKAKQKEKKKAERLEEGE